MSRVMDIPILLGRQALATAAATSAAAAETTAAGCDSGNDYDGRIGLRVSAIFVILIGSCFGAAFPTFAARHEGVGVPPWAFFIAKYFGSGVIIATAFIHLLAPANDALTDPCLTGPITDYDWVEGIALMAVFVLFFVELLAMRYAVFGGDFSDDEHDHSLSRKHSHTHELASVPDREHGSISSAAGPHARGSDHLGHSRSHTANELERQDGKHIEDYAAQVTAIFILEFGVVFHSVFVGLTLAVAGDEFKTLYVVLVFHQTFEGLGLGSRLAAVPWPQGKRWTPYILAVGYGLSTPISIAIGLGVRNAYAPGSQTALIVNGVFDSISAGILIYTGLVELMAHEFMFSPYMRRARISKVASASGLMCLGAGLMALLGKWA
ncbi:MAG: hypothetical protein Q9195_005149 [Heterodermia aff. obscurata]